MSLLGGTIYLLGDAKSSGNMYNKAMNILKEILANEVYPALGCTEPTACAFAAAGAAAQLGGEPVTGVKLGVDRSTFKNGAAVTVPHSGGRKGNLIAAVLGALVAKPESKLEVLSHVTPEIRDQAQRLVDDGTCELVCLEEGTGLHIDAEVTSANHTGRCVLAVSHTNVERIEKDGKIVPQAGATAGGGGQLAYRDAMRKMDFAAVLALAESLEQDDLDYLDEGVTMNLAMSDQGFQMEGAARQLRRMKDDGYLADDMFFRTKTRVASAVDARMGGLDRAVMTSGGSGNQGIVTTLMLHSAGEEMGIPTKRILESIAVAHSVNAYVKCFVGDLAVICGCAMAAGIAAAVGMVYQKAGPDIGKMTLAVNNVIGDLGGLICDGAKPGCSMKAITSVDAAMRSALMALGGYGTSTDEGVVGRTIEESIRNLASITLEGMFEVDPTVLKILRDKSTGSGKA